MLATLLSLGVWQLHRRTGKLALLADIDRGEASPAIPLPPQSPPAFAKVRVEGHFRDDLQALYGSDVRDLPNGSAIGAQLIEPLERPGETPILVDRGWVPTDPAFIEPGTNAVEGYIRLPDKPGALSPSDDPESRRFYTLDPAAIGASLGLQAVAPFTLVALGTAPPGVFPIPATALPRPPNDHLNYAFTWFSLAAVLLVVFTLWSRKVLRP